MVPAIMLAAASTRYTKPVGYDDDQPRSHPPLGSYGPNNEGLSDISTGWHIFADGNMWCAVGPTYIDLHQSSAGFGFTPREAFFALMQALGREAARKGYESAAVAKAQMGIPSFNSFQIHQPTVKPDVR